jgi:phosphoserine aminotransferase
VNIAASSQDQNFSYIPERSAWKLSPDAAYVHITGNETIGGIEYHWIPEVSVPLVADVSSNFLSKPVDVSKYALIYGGAQKNVGGAGLTIVILRDDLAALTPPKTPAMLSYAVQAGDRSMFNTPPTYAIYIAGLTFQWLKRQGGLSAMAERNLAKAKLLYDYLDQSAFFLSPARKSDRSLMNVTFTLKNPEFDADFLKGAKDRGMIELKGHRSVGGMRASIYNAMPVEGIERLVSYLKDYETAHA